MFARGVVAAGLMILVALAPLPLGSNRDWGWSPLAAATGALLLLQAMSALRPEAQAFAFFRMLIVPLALVAAVVAWMIVQALVLVPDAWENPIRSATRAALPPDPNSPIALDREQAITGLMRLLAYVGVFLLAADIGASPRAARSLYGVVVCSAVAYTLYALVAVVANRMAPTTGVGLFVPQEGEFTGPFINRNNYATYAALAALAAITMAVASIRPFAMETEAESLAQRWRRRLDAISGAGGLWLAAAMILIFGVLLSGSRAGSTCLVLGLIAMMALFSYSWRRVTIVVLLLGLAAAMIPAGSALIERMGAITDASGTSRSELFALAVDGIVLRPLLGWGANSFESLFAVFQPPTIAVYFDKAHNSYLEVAFELGVPAAAALTAAVTWVAVRCLRGTEERAQNRELCALGFCVSLVAGCHALVDFSLQIPGFATVYAAILGTAWAQSWSSRRLAI